MDSDSTKAQRPRAARQLVQRCGAGVLATISRQFPGCPYGSLTNYAVNSYGRPLFLFSTLAAHTRNLAEESKASLLVFGEEALQDPLAAARVTVLGTIGLAPAPEMESARAAYLRRHPDSAMYIDFGDFAIYRMTIVDIYYIGGFGEMGWVAPAEYDEHP
jgi:heme iron utilization protein